MWNEDLPASQLTVEYQVLTPPRVTRGINRKVGGQNVVVTHVS